MRAAVTAFAVALLAAGCWDSQKSVIAISPDRPPSPATWPPYPKFSQRSCWTSPGPATEVMRAAPSSPIATPGPRTPPNELARRVLERFGDRSLIHGVRIGRRPAQTRPFRPRKDPPKDALWAYIDAPLSLSASAPPANPDAEDINRRALAEWEVLLFWGALRDDFCQADGRPLVGYSVSGQIVGLSTDEYAFNQRFPNPTPEAFRARVAQIGERYGFRPVSVRFVRPRELAPIVVVETDRDRKEFIADVSEIVSLMDPESVAKHQAAQTFEGLSLEARDDDGPFVRVYGAYRGTVMGGQWSADDNYPYPHG